MSKITESPRRANPPSAEYRSKLVQLQNAMEEQAGRLAQVPPSAAKRVLDWIENEQLVLALLRVGAEHDPVGQAQDYGRFHAYQKLGDILRTLIEQATEQPAAGEGDEA